MTSADSADAAVQVPMSVRMAAALASAAVVAYGVLVLHWPVLSIMLLFWLENVVIGVFNVMKMLVTGLRGGVAATAGALFTAAFFTVHYGLFCFAHGGIVLMLFGPGRGAEATAVLDMVRDAMNEQAFTFALGGIVLMHCVDFIGWMRGARPARADALMLAPYARIVLLHLTLIFGAMLIERFGTPVAGLLLLVVLKLVADLLMLMGRSPRPRSAQAVEVRGPRS